MNTNITIEDIQKKIDNLEYDDACSLADLHEQLEKAKKTTK